MTKIRLEDKIPVDNLCNWALYFPRVDGQGEVKIPANAKNFSLLTFNELQMQVQVRNPMIIGTDEIGSHARIKIVNPEHYKALFAGDTEIVDPPKILTMDAVKELLNVPTKKNFIKEMETLVQTSAEKKMLVELAKQANAENVEAWKISEIENYTGMTF